MKHQKKGDKTIGIFNAKKSKRELNRINNKKLNKMEVINEVCKKILTITDKEVSELREVAKGQEEYHNPLKMGTTIKQHKLGEYNKQVLDKVLELKELLISGAEICK